MQTKLQAERKAHSTSLAALIRIIRLQNIRSRPINVDDEVVYRDFILQSRSGLSFLAAARRMMLTIFGTMSPRSNA